MIIFRVFDVTLILNKLSYTTSHLAEPFLFLRYNSVYLSPHLCALFIAKMCSFIY